MKIGIITFSNRNNMPYLKYYEEILKKEKIPYECVFWDRFTDNNIEKKNNEYTLHIKCLPGGNKIGKIIPMFKYKYIVERIIANEKYTHLIVLTTLPAVLLKKSLLKNFKDKYILDIRDYTYEKYSFYKKIVDELVDNSYFTSISSKGFLEFLNANEKIVSCHNISNTEFTVNYSKDLKNKKHITIGFVGNIRYFKENCKFIDALANSPKYSLIYIGRENIDCNLKDYCKRKNIKNVIFFGEYKNEDKPIIYQNIDLINSVYGDNSLEVSTLLPNRLYDGLLLKKPIIATKGTYLGKLITNRNLGLSINLNNNFVETNIDNYVNKFDSKKFNLSCNEFLEKIKIEQKQYFQKILSFVKEINCEKMLVLDK